MGRDAEVEFLRALQRHDRGGRSESFPLCIHRFARSQSGQGYPQGVFLNPLGGRAASHALAEPKGMISQNWEFDFRSVYAGYKVRSVDAFGANRLQPIRSKACPNLGVEKLCRHMNATKPQALTPPPLGVEYKPLETGTSRVISLAKLDDL